MSPASQETWSFMKNSMILLLVFALSVMSTNIDPGVLLSAWHWFIDKALVNALSLAPETPVRYGSLFVAIQNLIFVCFWLALNLCPI